MVMADAAVTFANQPQILGIAANVMALAAAIVFTLALSGLGATADPGFAATAAAWR